MPLKKSVTKRKPTAKKKKSTTKRTVTRVPADPSATFEALRDLLLAVGRGFERQKETDKELMLLARSKRPRKEPLFAGVAWRKTYVSFYLFPVYEDPSLLEGISRPLRAKMQGKSCFNFLRVEPEAFAELEQLTRRCKDWLGALER